jgi:uncharacterized protein
MTTWTPDASMPRIDAIEASERTFLQRVFGWMAAGLGITGAIALWISQPDVLPAVYGGRSWLLIGLFIAQLLLVFAISGAVSKLKPGLATGLFLVYSGLSGMTLAPLIAIYTEASVSAAFLAAAGTFAACAAYGYFTKTDLTKFGGIMAMLLIGGVIATAVNLFLVKSAGLDRVLTYVMIFVFVGLTAWDTQKLKDIHRNGTDGGTADRALAIQGALMLYLDFINLFLLLLKVLGKRRQ